MWGERSISLLRCLPHDCRNRQLIIAVLTLPLGEFDEVSSHRTMHVVMGHTVQSKKSKGQTAVGACLMDLLKWPRIELETTLAIHEGESKCFSVSPVKE
jgi:hypothetical protein